VVVSATKYFNIRKDATTTICVNMCYLQVLEVDSKCTFPFFRWFADGIRDLSCTLSRYFDRLCRRG
jgi:hypothetical protein